MTLGDTRGLWTCIMGHFGHFSHAQIKWRCFFFQAEDGIRDENCATISSPVGSDFKRFCHVPEEITVTRLKSDRDEIAFLRNLPIHRQISRLLPGRLE